MTAAHGGPVEAIVLAAGAGRRFGPGKVLAELDGLPLMAHAIAAARAAGMRTLAVVPLDSAVEAAAVRAGADAVVTSSSPTGMSSSLATGIAALAPDTAAAVILLADQPGVRPEVIVDLIDAWRRAPATPWRVRYLDGAGHPVVLPAAAWPMVLAVRGDRGARELLPELGVRELHVDLSAPQDVDTPEDLVRLRAVATTDQRRPGAGPA